MGKKIRYISDWMKMVGFMFSFGLALLLDRELRRQRHSPPKKGD